MLPLFRRYFESNVGAADLLGLFDHLLKSVEISDDGLPEGILPMILSYIIGEIFSSVLIITPRSPRSYLDSYHVVSQTLSLGKFGKASKTRGS